VPRRYLTISEGEAALRRGKAVECFLGACDRSGIRGFRWLSIRQDSEAILASVYETAPAGDMLDVYELPPLDPDREPDEADEVFAVTQHDEIWSVLEGRFPGSTARLVNEGVIQDEYADFIAYGRR
jgi:hypothetical protein